ncbi:MAG: glycoside hydrolase family 88 protein [Paludibacter sp.]|jgi:unsaturated chondroitin disaccharide hydrolase
MNTLINEVFTLAEKQYIQLAKQTYQFEGRLPRSTDSAGNLVTSDRSWWTSGFFPGSLWYIFEYTQDTTMLHYAQKFSNRIESEKFTTNNHDVGFMLYCSFGNGYRLTHDKSYPEILLTSSNSLITRYRPKIESIQSWDKSEFYNCPVIIDNMMNLEMLFWVSKFTNDPKYREVAVNHANSTIKNHFRKDFSSYHVVDYDLTDGHVIKKVTNQGCADASAWARGQAWGLYGFTMCYRETKDKRYLMQAQHIANFILLHPNLPTDKIPYWDFNAPDIPNEPRDASAAAIIASALIELSGYSPKKEALFFKSCAEKILRSLASHAYLAKQGTNGGFLLMHCVGNMPKKSEIDTPLTYADYYFLEALLRYKAKYIK